MAGFRVTSLLQGKVSLITGAGNGICQAFALRFAAAGASVGILDSVLEGLNRSNS